MNSVSSEYEQKGYTVIRGLLPAHAVAMLQAECIRLLREEDCSPNNIRTVSRRTLGGGETVDRFDPVTDLSAPFAQVARDPVVLDLARLILGDEPLLMKDKLIFKAPGVHGYEVHQDYQVWQELPAPAQSIVSVLVAIDNSHEENGAVAFYAGLHERLWTSPGTPTDLFSPRSGVVPEEFLEGTTPELVALEAGDAVIFSSLTPHHSSPNRTQFPRRSLFLTYSAARFGDLYGAYYKKFHEYRLRDAGQKADSLYFR